MVLCAVVGSETLFCAGVQVLSGRILKTLLLMQVPGASQNAAGRLTIVVRHAERWIINDRQAQAQTNLGNADLFGVEEKSVIEEAPLLKNFRLKIKKDPWGA
jgi:hypothetical protein